MPKIIAAFENDNNRARICVYEDGSLYISCDDDYYDGTLTAPQAIELATKILLAATKSVTGKVGA